jgi:hypothetical protein
MAQFAEHLLHEGDHGDNPDHRPDCLYRDLGFQPDSPTGIAYAISEWTISIVGPVFWISIIYLFLIAELGKSFAR